MTHTPGPWETNGKYTRGHGVAIHSDDGHVADAKGFMETATIEANARLIAAAPDLLEALTRLERTVRMLPPDMDEPDSPMAQARSAIAKATHKPQED